MDLQRSKCFEKKGMLELKLSKTSGKILIHDPLWDFIMRYHRLEQTKPSFRHLPLMGREARVIRNSYLLDRMTCVLCELAIEIVLDTNKLVCFIFYIISLQRKVQ